MEYRQIRYFLVTAEELHFRKAAEKLFITQPGLSRQIRQLEEELDLSLFVRNNRSVQLTPAGEYLYSEFKSNIGELHNLIEHARLIDSGIKGKLRIGYIGSAMNRVIPELLLQFREEFGKIVFNLKELDNQQQVNHLLSQSLDIGFVRLERVPESLRMVPVLEEPFCLVLPGDHPVNSDNFEGLQQLKDEAFIMFDANYSPSYYNKVMLIFEEYGISPIISHETIHASSIFRLVENKFGISIVPRSLQYGYDLNIKFIELNDSSQRTVLNAIWNKNRRNPVLENLQNYIRETLEIKS
ncbi:LysR family transcriptional regulator [Gramella sp. GC03-9]|uniref:LysR family transcriptional regulator n=1 Tax=Christiangramia oceanisediminis TaxID=2920386 RepID=A0A9X2KVF9_9FLAO|nr:LysR family transcriptional regulator [Gramella oceanisediminis]MCP9198403.1 LysR family transcriptional regulator [Gramella oceanisediminis]